MRNPVLAVFLVATMSVAVSCRREEIKTYRVAKESTPAMPAGMAASMAAPQNPGVTWEAPDTWTPTAPNSVRIGSYSIPNPAGGDPADYSITSFPGDVGGDLANVNRWRQQIALPPVTAEELPSLLKPVQAPAGEFIAVNFVNSSSGSRVIAALFKQPDRTWFFKLAGPDALVASQESAFLALLQTVKFEEGATPAGGAIAGSGGAVNTNDLPAGHPPIGGFEQNAQMPAAMPGAPEGPAPAEAPADLAIRWAAPDHWTPKALGQMRKGSYTVHGDGTATADFSIISLPGAAGGFHENINRWRGQIGLPPQDAATIDTSVAHIENAGFHFDVVDFAGSGADAQRVIGAIMTFGNDTWFFKLSGPDTLVETEHASFINFLKTVRPR